MMGSWVDAFVSVPRDGDAHRLGIVVRSGRESLVLNVPGMSGIGLGAPLVDSLGPSGGRGFVGHFPGSNWASTSPTGWEFHAVVSAVLVSGSTGSDSDGLILTSGLGFEETEHILAIGVLVSPSVHGSWGESLNVSARAQLSTVARTSRDLSVRDAASDGTSPRSEGGHFVPGFGVGNAFTVGSLGSSGSREAFAHLGARDELGVFTCKHSDGQNR